MTGAGVGISVTVSVRRGWEISIDNFFNTQNIFIRPITDLIGRPLTQFEFYLMIFFIICCVVVVGVIFYRRQKKNNIPQNEVVQQEVPDI
jgi:Ca2+/Na+ antiporter